MHTCVAHGGVLCHCVDGEDCYLSSYLDSELIDWETELVFDGFDASSIPLNHVLSDFSKEGSDHA